MSISGVTLQGVVLGLKESLSTVCLDHRDHQI